MEGVRSVGEALGAGAGPIFALVAPRLDTTSAGEALRARLGATCEVFEVDDGELTEVADTDHPQGVLLVAREPESPEEPLPNVGRVLVVDAVQDPGNLGTLIRSAAAFAIDAVVCLDGTVDPWGAKAVRASAGTIFRVPVRRTSSRALAMVLGGADAAVAVASGEGRPMARVFGEGVPLSVLVVGNEGAGVRPELRALATETVAIPMKGPVESLNVGVAGSILLYEWTR